MTLNIPERYVYAINILIAALIIPYLLARTVSAIIKQHYAASVEAQPLNLAPTADGNLSGPQSRAAYNIIKERDVFNVAPAPEIAAPVEKEDLGIKLLGTSHLTGGARDFAIIEDATGAEQLYRLGETIPDVGRVVQISKNRAVIMHNGHRVAIEIPKDSLGDTGDDEGTPPAIQRPHGLRSPFIRNPMLRRARPTAKAGGVHRIAPHKYLVDRSTIDSDMRNMSQLLTQVRALPVMENGTSNGFRLSEIQPGSLFDQLGLEDGDVLTSIAGQQLTDPARALQMLSTLQTRSDVSINLLRNGSPVLLNYTIH